MSSTAVVQVANLSDSRFCAMAWLRSSGLLVEVGDQLLLMELQLLRVE